MRRQGTMGKKGMTDKGTGSMKKQGHERQRRCGYKVIKDKGILRKGIDKARGGYGLR